MESNISEIEETRALEGKEETEDVDEERKREGGGGS